MAEEQSKMVAIDLNDMGLQTEQLEINTDADAFAFPPPMDDGVHRSKLALGTDAWKQGRSRDDKPFLMVHIEARPLEGEGNGVLFDRASTMVMQSSGTCRVAGIIKAISGQPAVAKDSVGLARELNGLLAGNPVVKVESQWEATCANCEPKGKAGRRLMVKRGQRNFPKFPSATNGAPARYKHEVSCPSCGDTVSAQARIVGYKSDAAAAPATETATITENPFGS